MQKILHYLEQINPKNSLVLTPNNRLADFLLSKFNEQKIQNKSWEPLFIKSYKNWLEQIYSDLGLNPKYNLPRCLSSLEQMVLIKKIFHIETQDNFVEQIIHNIMLSKEYLIPLSEIENNSYSFEQISFAKLFSKYSSYLKENHFCDANDLVSLIVNQNLLMGFEFDEIVLLDFLEITPQFNLMLKYFSGLGVGVKKITISDFENKKRFLPCENLEKEITSAAKYALEQEGTTAILVPQLNESSNLIQGRLYKLLQSDDKFVILKANELDNYNLIKSVYMIVNLLQDKIYKDTIIQLFYSPFITEFEEEGGRRAEVCFELMSKLNYQISWPKFIELLDEYKEKIPILFFNVTVFYEYYIKKFKKHYDVTKWAKCFHQFFSLIGFPGSRDLNVLENNLYEKVFECLKQYTSLNSLQKSHNLSDAVSYLKYILEKKKYTPQINKKIVIAEPESIIGIPFDTIWFCQMNKGIWPGESIVYPYLSADLQKKYQLPKVSPNEELNRIKKVTEHIEKQSSSNVIYSYSEYIDESKSFPSSLLPECERLELIENEQEIEFARLENYEDDFGPELDSEYVASGVRFLEAQSLCPFKAFSEMRLNVKSIFETQLGFNPIERGKIIHEVLQFFYEMHRTKESLSSDFALVHLRGIIEDVLQKYIVEKEENIPKFISNIEKDRLFKLASKMIEIDKKRKPFKVVELESEKKVSLSGILFKVKVDRIDEVENEKIIIDYKTGSCSTSDWFANFKSPQLPLYAITLKPKGISFACLKNKQFGYTGVAASKMIEKVQVMESWEAQIEDWENKIEHLIESYKKGEAKLQPLEGKKTCDSCNLKTFCRISQY